MSKRAYNFSRIFSQAVKELAQFRRDPITVGLAFFLPMIALFLYGYATRLEVKDMPVVVMNHDKGKLSRDYIDRFFSTNQLIPVRYTGHKPLEPLDRGIARATIIIPPEFSSAIKARKTVVVQALVDASDVNNARVIKNSIIGTTNSFMQSEGLTSFRPVLKPEVRLWFNPGREEALNIVPGAIALVLWVFPSLLASIALVREKEQGTILQLYTSSMSAFELIVGKLLAYCVVAILEAVIVLLAAMLFFGLWFVGNVIGFFINLLLFVAAAVNFGLLAGAVSANQNAAVQIVATVGFTSTLLLSGFIYPVRNITYPLSLVSNIIPARYFVEACRDTFVRGPELFSHWYIPLALLAANIVLLRLSSRKMAAMKLKG
ncbi:MAG: ABC transporter permease [Candidatus Obscuribacterales bacterium]|nr:ABC transporter permease [Candidatus Obscuribacterales bacterium]